MCSPRAPEAVAEPGALCIEMNAPQIELLGVYSLHVTDDLVREEAECRYDEPSPEEENEIRQELSSIALVEVMVRNPDAKFDVGDFRQPQEGVDPAMWQVAWREVFLTEDGRSLAQKPPGNSCSIGPLRIAFFIHFWQGNVPLLSSYGDIICPSVQEMPQRLVDLISYVGVD